MNRKLFFALSSVIALAACQKKTVEITGTLENPLSGQYLFLSELKADDIVAYDSVLITEEGTFNFKLNIKNPSFYLLKNNQKNFLTMLLEPGEKINMTAAFDSINYPSEFKGSPGTELLIRYNDKLRNTIDNIMSLSKIYVKRMDQPGLPELIDSLDRASQGYLEDINAYTKRFIDDNPSSLASITALYQQVAPDVYVLDPMKDIEYFRKVNESLSALYPENDHVIKLQQQIMVYNENLQYSVDDFYGTGNIAPEIALPSPEGDTISLSSTRGSIVLLDFWASWCPPCREENPNLVKAWERFHSKGFQIFQVSLDKTREAWIKGIEDDKLGKWIHVSDLKYWNSSVVPLYKIESIPANYLIDKDGYIISSNLRGEELIQKLELLFK